MIIGIDASRANHNQRTGVEEYAFQIIQNWKKIIPEDVRVILYTDKSLQGELAELPQNWTQKVLKWSPRRLWTQIRLSWEMLWHAPDILFIPAHVFPLVRPKKTIMTVHDIAAVRFSDSYNWFERCYSIWSAKLAVKYLWRVIVPSEFVRKEIIKTFSLSEENNMIVIPHGYDKNFLNILDFDQRENRLKKYQIQIPFIVSIGRLEEKKNTVGIIKAFEKLENSDLRLVLIGKPGYGYEKVQKAIENSNKKDKIIVPGWVSKSDLPTILNLSSVFVFPSFYEGFGLPILEAFASDTPVVAASGHCLEEVGGEACLYVESNDIENLSQTIEKVLSNPDLKDKMIKSGRERLEYFSWEKAAQMAWNIIEKS